MHGLIMKIGGGVEEPCFIPCVYVVREFVVFISHIDEVIESACLGSFFFSDASMGDTKCCTRGACSTGHEGYRDIFIQKFQPLTQFGPQISYCHFSLPLASFVDVDGRRLRGSSSTLSRPLWKRQVTHLRFCHMSLSMRLLQHG